jgi:hypothetical protein
VFGLERDPPLGHPAREVGEVDPGLPRLREHAAFLLLHVVVHELAEHLDLRIEQRITGRPGADLADQVHRRLALDAAPRPSAPRRRVAARTAG